jgi:methionyl-tRNA formyltransferase
MRVAILTTDTPHHRYFVNRLTAHCDIVGVLLEDFEPEPPLPAQEEIEREVFGSLGEQWMTGLVVHHFASLNNHDPIEWLGLLTADLGIVFGTGKLEPDVFNVPKHGSINIHRGLTSHYRGLDCDLWAVYDYHLWAVCVTIHRVSEELDRGEVYHSRRIGLAPGMTLGNLRAAGTLTALSMIDDAMYRAINNKPLEPGGDGKYFSRMGEDQRKQAERRLQENLTGGYMGGYWDDDD